MKRLLLIVSIFISISASSQFYLNMSEAGVRKLLKGKSNIIKKTDQVFPYIMFEYNSKTIAILYFQDNTCKKSFSLKLLPEDEIVQKTAIEFYNKNFVITSIKSWRYYSKGRIYNIILDFDSESKQNCFFITEL